MRSTRRSAMSLSRTPAIRLPGSYRYFSRETGVSSSSDGIASKALGEKRCSELPRTNDDVFDCTGTANSSTLVAITARRS